MKALSIRQPWAWLITHAEKDIENRRWRTHFRGRFLIHASAGCTLMEYQDAKQFVFEQVHSGIIIPPLADLPRGGIVGQASLVDCVADSCSWWFSGPYGFVLADPKPLPFKPCKGSLKFFEVEI
jgi:hypothetical protein